MFARWDTTKLMKVQQRDAEEPADKYAHKTMCGEYRLVKLARDYNTGLLLLVG